MSNQIMHFEIPADDVPRAKTFYEKTFGWKIKAFPMPPGEEYFGVTTMKKGEPGINGGLMKRKMPGQPFTNYVSVKSIDATNIAVEANGGVIVLPKQEIGMGMGWISAFKDPESNIIGLHQAAPPAPAPKPSAAKKAAKPATRGKKAPKTAKKKSKKRRG
jgi:predicted enzyme related to lactoylglutathione lyase